MGKSTIEELTKELERMSKRLKKVAGMMNNLSHIDSEFEKKVDELMGASLITETWAEDISEEYLEKDRNEKK